MINFKQRLEQEILLGTFVKTPHPHIIEVLALADLPFVVLDAEHAPFDRASLDLCIMAAKASGLTCVVRVQNNTPSTILNALDCGAVGVQIPHICTAEQAEKLVKVCHYGEGGRGYAGSSRAAKYATKPMTEHLKDSKANTVVIAQIEDPQGVENVESIVNVNGIDALFIGQVDLTIAYGADSIHNEKVVQASMRVIEAAKAANKPIGMFVATAQQARKWRELGVSFFCVGSEHKMIIDGFKQERNVMNS
ncbi:HpcH/HpaI aldolase/citrate lyase family protein [Vibrio rumoiensis]|uniref:HpcH/HpaI aldolase family protein n=1 Tax=Vibrio rumoiensis TaxID=76258 RepID=UPI0037497AD0